MVTTVVFLCIGVVALFVWNIYYMIFLYNNPEYVDDKLGDLNKEVESLRKRINLVSRKPNINPGDVVYRDGSFDKFTVDSVFIDTICDYMGNLASYEWYVSTFEDLGLDDPYNLKPNYLPASNFLTEAQYNELKSKICKSKNK